MLVGLPVRLVQKELSFDIIRKMSSHALMAYNLSEGCYKTVNGGILAIIIYIVGPEG